MKQAYIKEQLLQKLSIFSNIKERTYPIVVPFLPITLDTNDPSFNCQVKTKNDLPTNSMDSARWIKPPYRHSSQQRVAYAMFLLNDPLHTDQLIRDGIFIGKDKFFLTKDKKELVC